MILQAWQDGHVSPATLSYIEAHGTGTPLGDPVELEALSRAFADATSHKQFCTIGSAKSVIGHADATAGLAGLLKVLLSFEHQLLPPARYLTEPNPRIPLEKTALTLIDHERRWPRSALPRRAGISSFGFTGTNAHAVVEEPPGRRAAVGSGCAWPLHLLVLSAASPTALTALAKEYLRWLEQQSDRLALGDICYTAALGRAHRQFRLAFVFGSRAQLHGQFELWIAGTSDDELLKAIVFTKATGLNDRPTNGTAPASIPARINCQVSMMLILGRFCFKQLLGSM